MTTDSTVQEKIVGEESDKKERWWQSRWLYVHTLVIVGGSLGAYGFLRYQGIDLLVDLGLRPGLPAQEKTILADSSEKKKVDMKVLDVQEHVDISLPEEEIVEDDGPEAPMLTDEQREIIEEKLRVAAARERAMKAKQDKTLRAQILEKVNLLIEQGKPNASKDSPRELLRDIPRIWTRRRDGQLLAASVDSRKKNVLFLKDKDGKLWTTPIVYLSFADINWISRYMEKDARDRLHIVSSLYKEGQHYIGKLVERKDDAIRFRIEGVLSYQYIDSGSQRIKAHLKEHVQKENIQELREPVELNIPSRIIALLQTVHTRHSEEVKADVLDIQRYYYDRRLERLVFIRQPEQLTELVLPYYIRDDQGKRVNTQGDRLLTFLSGVVGVGGESQSKITSGAIALVRHNYARGQREGCHYTKTVEGITLHWDRATVELVSGSDKRIPRYYQRAVPCYLLTGTVSNERAHPVTVWVRGGYFQKDGGLFPEDLTSVNGGTHAANVQMVIAPHASKQFFIGFVKQSRGSMDKDDIDVQLLTDQEWRYRLNIESYQRVKDGELSFLLAEKILGLLARAAAESASNDGYSPSPSSGRGSSPQRNAQRDQQPQRRTEKKSPSGPVVLTGVVLFRDPKSGSYRPRKGVRVYVDDFAIDPFPGTNKQTDANGKFRVPRLARGRSYDIWIKEVRGGSIYQVKMDRDKTLEIRVNKTNVNVRER